MAGITARRHRKRKLKAEINVVPYIDVMLVLLIIFMVTAPLLNLGVDIDLPQSNAKSIQEKKDPVIVSVDAQGNYFLTVKAGSNEAVTAQTLEAKVRGIVSQNPDDWRCSSPATPRPTTRRSWTHWSFCRPPTSRRSA